MEVQQNFIKALIKECLSIQHWGKIKAYIDLAMKNVETDLEAGSVVWFAANVLGLNGGPALKMEDVTTCTLPGDYWGSAWSREADQAHGVLPVQRLNAFFQVDVEILPIIIVVHILGHIKLHAVRWDSWQCWSLSCRWR